MTHFRNREELQSGIDLFNRAQFFEAHEVLEDIWRALPRERAVRRHMQGMVQLAVAFHHESAGNRVGARSVLERAMRNLRGADRSFPELDFQRLRAALADWREHLASPLRPQALRPQAPQILPRKLQR